MAAAFPSRPRWLVDLHRRRRPDDFPTSCAGRTDGLRGRWRALEASAVCWEDLAWIRQQWNGPIVIKGVHTADDARRAVDAGAGAVVVSNHGGRQRDGVAATLRVLPEVVEAVGNQVEVLLDGGIRRGGDIVKALCLGARAVLIGRAYAYGLGAAGQPGVARAIDLLRSDVTRTLKLLGCPSVAVLECSYVIPITRGTSRTIGRRRTVNSAIATSICAATWRRTCAGRSRGFRTSR